MSFKEKFFQKLLNKSKSYAFYKNNYHSLTDDLKKSEKELNSLNNKLAQKDLEIDELKRQLIDKEDGFVFSIVIPIYNTEKYISETIDSVINQSFVFDKVQIVLVDDGSTDRSGEICREYVKRYPDNIKYVYQENQGTSAARNNGIKFADGKFVNYLDSDDKLESNALEEVYYHINKFGDEVDVISIRRYRFDASEGPMPFYDNYDDSCIVDIEKVFDFPITPVNSAFLRREAALNFKFDGRVIISEDSLFINKLILEKGKFGVVGTTRYLYRKRPEEDSLVDTKKFDKRYFNTRMELYFKELMDYSVEKYGHVIKYIQYVLMYDLKWFFLQNTEVNVLDEGELKEFRQNIYDVLQVIDDDVILSQDFSKFLKYHMLEIKHGKSNCRFDDNKLMVNENAFDEIGDNPIIVCDISLDNGTCILKASFTFYFNDIKINAFNNGQLISTEQDIEENVAIGNVFEYNINLTGDIELDKGSNDIIFELEFDSNKYVLPVILNDDSMSSNSIYVEDEVLRINN